MKATRPDAATSVRMAGIRQKGTKIEAAVAMALRELGLHYRKNVKQLPGSPDFANQTRRWAVFVNGCFWHHHSGCPRATVPKSNSEFWRKKFHDNRRRDARAIRQLRQANYQVILIWECEQDRLRLKLGEISEAGRINTR